MATLGRTAGAVAPLCLPVLALAIVLGTVKVGLEKNLDPERGRQMFCLKITKNAPEYIQCTKSQLKIECQQKLCPDLMHNPVIL